MQSLIPIEPVYQTLILNVLFTKCHTLSVLDLTVTPHYRSHPSRCLKWLKAHFSSDKGTGFVVTSNHGMASARHLNRAHLTTSLRATPRHAATQHSRQSTLDVVPHIWNPPTNRPPTHSITPRAALYGTILVMYLILPRVSLSIFNVFICTPLPAIDGEVSRGRGLLIRQNLIKNVEKRTVDPIHHEIY